MCQKYNLHCIQKHVIVCSMYYNPVQYTVPCRYNAVQYNMILHTPLQWLGQIINESLKPHYNPPPPTHPTPTPHPHPPLHTPYPPPPTHPTPPTNGQAMGVFCEDLWENWPRYNGTAL